MNYNGHFRHRPMKDQKYPWDQKRQIVTFQGAGLEIEEWWRDRFKILLPTLSLTQGWEIAMSPVSVPCLVWGEFLSGMCNVLGTSSEPDSMLSKFLCALFNFVYQVAPCDSGSRFPHWFSGSVPLSLVTEFFIAHWDTPLNTLQRFVDSLKWVPRTFWCWKNGISNLKRIPRTCQEIENPFLLFQALLVFQVPVVISLITSFFVEDWFGVKLVNRQGSWNWTNTQRFRTIVQGNF